MPHPTPTGQVDDHAAVADPADTAVVEPADTLEFDPIETVDVDPADLVLVHRDAVDVEHHITEIYDLDDDEIAVLAEPHEPGPLWDNTQPHTGVILLSLVAALFAAVAIVAPLTPVRIVAVIAVIVLLRIVHVRRRRLARTR